MSYAGPHGKKAVGAPRITGRTQWRQRITMFVKREVIDDWAETFQSAKNNVSIFKWLSRQGRLLRSQAYSLALLISDLSDLSLDDRLNEKYIFIQFYALLKKFYTSPCTRLRVESHPFTNQYPSMLADILFMSYRPLSDDFFRSCIIYSTKIFSLSFASCSVFGGAFTALK